MQKKHLTLVMRPSFHIVSTLVELCLFEPRVTLSLFLFFSIAVFSCFSSVLFGLPLCCLDSALPIWICLPHWLISCVQNPVLAFKTILTAALCLQLCNWIQELVRTSPLPVHGIFSLKGKAVCNFMLLLCLFANVEYIFLFFYYILYFWHIDRPCEFWMSDWIY